MGTDGMLVNHAALDQSAQDLVAAVKSIQGRMQSLEQELNPLQKDWEGAAQIAYTHAKQKWDTAINGMVEILQGTAQAVDQSNSHYADTDKKAAQTFSY